MTQISILGCGWLGLPLAKALLENGYTINGSTTTAKKLVILETAAIQPFLIAVPTDLNQDLQEGKTFSTTIQEFLAQSETLIIDIPPQLRSHSDNSAEKTFVKKIATLISFIEQSTIKNVLFVSSTSIFGEGQKTVTAATNPKPDTQSGLQLLEAELLLQDNKNFNTTSIRFGGLIGVDRQPAQFLAGKENIANPDAAVNLIHQEDCIGIILKIIETNCWNETFNAVSSFHPTRKDYYTLKAAELNLTLPQFDHSKPSIGKIIENDKVVHVLKYTFAQPNL